MFKKITYAILIIATASTLKAQNGVGINTSGTTPSVNAVLDLNSGNVGYNLGVIFPRVTLQALTTFNPPIAHANTGLDVGMVVYNSNSANEPDGYYYWNGTTWEAFSSNAATITACATAAANYLCYFSASNVLCNSIIYQVAGTNYAGVNTITAKNQLDVNGSMAVGSYGGTTAAPANGMLVSGQVGVGTSAPLATAAMDVTSTTLGFLPPQMTTTHMNSIAAPTPGLMILNTSNNCLYYYGSAATGWQPIACPCTAAPATPSAITGCSVAEDGTSYTYSISSPTGTGISYNWTYPAGALVTSGMGTTSITVTMGAYSGNVSVTATNSCGTSAASTLAVTEFATPTAPGAITGNSIVLTSCASTYSVAAVAGATSYTWSVSSATYASVTAGGTTNVATISTTATPGTYTISVIANYCNGLSSAASTIAVTSEAAGYVSFAVTGGTQTWTVPACATTITIYMWGAGGGGGDYNNTTGSYGNAGGAGAYMTGTLSGATLPGTTLTLYVPTGGSHALTSAPAGGWLGGGTGAYSGVADETGGGGGGLAAVTVGGTGGTIYAVAGGGGGGGSYPSTCDGGGGGATTGGVGVDPDGGTYDAGGGTVAAGGAGGDSPIGAPDVGGAGSKLQGGTGNGSDYAGGGGGGGYYGGGGGGYLGGGGGGGSSYPTASVVAGGLTFTVVTNTVGASTASTATAPTSPSTNGTIPQAPVGTGSGGLNGAGAGGYIIIKY